MSVEASVEYISCKDMERARSALETARDARSFDDPESLLRFHKFHTIFVSARTVHRVDTGCEEFH